MVDWKLLDREQRGLLLAAQSKILKKDGKWSVPSQSGDRVRYEVDPDESHPCCTCPDFQIRGSGTEHICKHIVAVRIVRQRELFDDGSEIVTETITATAQTVRKTYAQDWKSYNAAQTTEKHQVQALLHDLCSMIQERPQHMGRPRLPLADAVFAAVFKVYSTVSGRRFMCDLKDAKERGYLNRMPHYNSIFAVMEDDAVTPILTKMIEVTALPMKSVETSFACDSSGFSASRFDRWYDHKFGQHRIQRTWVKCHVFTGTTTNVITAVQIHGKDANDGVQLPSMLAITAQNFRVREVSADMAYSSKLNLATIDAFGAMPLIPFKSNASGKGGGVWTKMFHYFNLHRDTFLSRYHQRSNVETTFAMVKAKFGDSVRSKTETAMRNECLCNFICHNLCCLIQAMPELGIDPTFVGLPSIMPEVKLA